MWRAEARRYITCIIERCRGWLQPASTSATVLGMQRMASACHHMRNVPLSHPPPMFTRKQNRLPKDVYVQQRAYSVTICTFNRQRHFLTSSHVEFCLNHLKSACKQSWEIYAYCFMADHLHLLMAPTNEDQNLIKTIATFKQLTGFHFKKTTGTPLWQKGYYDHILRNEESIKDVAAYILLNPQRAGLVDDWRNYPYLGSFVYDVNEL